MLKEITANSTSHGSARRPNYYYSDDVSDGLTIAVAGCGYWGVKHVRVLSAMPDVRRVIVVEPNRALHQKILATFPNITVVNELAEVLNQVHGVVIATPPHNHAEVALTALRAGKHVLIEKPIATSLKDARKIVKAGKSHGVHVIAGHTFEFNPVVHDLRRRMNEGELGEIRYIHSARLNLGLYRSDVNVVWDLAPHDISIMNFLLDETPSLARAWGSSCIATGVLDVAHFQLEYSRRRVVGYGYNSWIDPRKVRQLTVIGSRKMAIYDDVADEKLRIYDHGVVLPADHSDSTAPISQLPVGYRRGDVVSPNIDFQEPLQLENRYFIDCILGRRDLHSDGRNGLDVVSTLEAIDAAMASGKPVRIRSGEGRSTN